MRADNVASCRRHTSAPGSGIVMQSEIHPRKLESWKAGADFLEKLSYLGENVRKILSKRWIPESDIREHLHV